MKKLKFPKSFLWGLSAFLISFSVETSCYNMNIPTSLLFSLGISLIFFTVL